MAPLSDYITGTITLTNGSATFTGTGTGWEAAAFREGDTIIDVTGATEYTGVIASITDNGEGELTQPWEGPTLADVTYRMRYMADGQRVTAQARQLIELLGNGNLQALAGLPGSPQTFAMFTGQGAMVEVARNDLLTGLAFDVQVDTLADRDAYDAEDAGFTVLVSDSNGAGDAAIYTKQSGTPGDWSAPAYVSGPPPVPTLTIGEVTTGAPGAPAEVTSTPTPTGAELDFTIPTGQQGPAGAEGPEGPEGPTPTVEVGTVTTGDPGDPAVVTATPTATGVELDFTIPRGEDGEGGGGGADGRVFIDQFGAVGDGVADDTAAIQAGIDYCSPLGLVLVLNPEHTYRTTSQLTALQGQAVGGGPVYRPKIDGRGAVIAQDHSGWGIVIDPLCEWADQTSRRGVATFFLRNISFDGYQHVHGVRTTANCIKIGKAGFWVDPFDRPVGLEDILINGYHATAVLIEQCRHFDVNRLVVRDPRASAATVELRTLEDGFTGDITFNDCEFAGNTNDGINDSGCLFLHAERLSGSGQAQLRGVRFVNCVFYGTGTYLYSGGESQLNDIWFTDCAWDWTDAGARPRVDYAFKFRATNAGAQIDKLFVSNPYVVGYPGGGFLADNPSENGSFSDIQFRGGAVSGGSIPMEFIYVDGVSVRGMDFSAIVGLNPEQNILSFPDCSELVVSDCKETNCTNVGQFISVGGGNATSYVVENNTSYSASTDRTVNDYGGEDVLRRMANNFKPGGDDSWVLTGADPMVLPWDGSLFLVNSPVSFGKMQGAYQGRRVTLLFYGACTIYTGSATNEMFYHGGSTKDVANGEAVTFISDGNRWWIED